MFNLNELLGSLQLEQLDRLLFRGTSLALPLPKVYGGQVLAQALHAASSTVEAERPCHSLHAYFLRPGDDATPIIYEVDPIRDGGSFTTRRVVAIQNGKPIFNASMSFQAVESGLEHQAVFSMDDVPAPEGLESDAEWLKRYAEDYPGVRRPLALPPSLVDVRRATPFLPADGGPAGLEQGLWFRFKNCEITCPATSKVLLTYFSDTSLMNTALRPHLREVGDRRMMGASLDHALWFHCDVRVDDWVYYHMDSPYAGDSRGFSRGSFYSREGVLMASAAQEGLLRVVDKL